jgi:2-polyprenyl-3-methyl-5-hydroxy-6-metoxy-1,4-benzoquinol methylase
MDQATIAAYDKDAAAFAREWHDQPAPVDLHEVVEQFFVRGGRTADIGCGSGREVDWLDTNGFSAEGIDASEGLLSEARSRYPDLKFTRAELPELSGIAANRYDNVLCANVIMHLDAAEIAPAVHRLIDIVKPDGVLYLSWQVTDDDARDARGRLGTAVDAGAVRAELASVTATTFLDEEVVNAASGQTMHRLVVKKPGLPLRD